MNLTLRPGILTVASAYPDPPFNILQGNHFDGFDIQLMQAVCTELKLKLQLLSYTGENFNDIFTGLAEKQYDAVISGTTITPERLAMVLFSQPYCTFNQSIAINQRLTPNISSEKNLSGLVAGIQKGNTSDDVAKRLLANGYIANIRYYAYNKIHDAISDLNSGKIGLVIKLFPVLSTLIKNYSDLTIAFEVPTNEKIAIAYEKNNQALYTAIDQAIKKLKKKGIFTHLLNTWFGFIKQN